MKKWITLGVCILGMFSLTSFDLRPNNIIIAQNLQEDNEITATINKNTTEKELEDLKEFFLENGIELVVEKIEFNEQNEITGLSLVLKKGDSKSKYSSSSSEPIEDLELGFKNNNLYISNSGMFDIAAWRNQSNSAPRITDLDSIFKKHNFAFDFDFDFGKDGDSIFFNGNSINIDDLREKMMKSFQFEEDEDGNITINGRSFPSRFNQSRTFSFVDDPTIDKLIIIDGKESDFETLDTLAKEDKLEVVDFLKKETAISIYGKKAKDGAIIATTKR